MRELRLCTRLEAIEEELRSVKGTAVVTEHNGRLREGWQHLTERLEEADIYPAGEYWQEGPTN